MESGACILRLERFAGFAFASLLIAILLIAPGIFAQQAVDLDGARVAPLERWPGKVLVLVFVRTDCPISNRYAPMIRELSAKYAHAAAIVLVFPDKAETPEAIRAYLGEFGSQLAVLRDTKHELVKKARVRVTPDTAVFNAKRELVYHGRIDDLYPSLGKSRTAATTHELADAIEAAIKGIPPPKASADGVGCFIADLQ